MKIAILGWGSLLWDRRADFDEQIGSWEFDGPKLKLEFSRISQTRSGALTLVIDDQAGTPCPVAFAMSRRSSLDDAICDLRCREGTVHRRIGYLVRKGGEQGSAQVPETVTDWLSEKDADAVVWTALKSNFKERKGVEFSIENALRYIAELPPEGKAAAAEYIWRAPDFVKTELRTAIEIEPWFVATRDE
ncbi:MAG: hypothetical protein WC692_02160 [Erythrobacter sp.]|jgi:hypothetical protein